MCDLCCLAASKVATRKNVICLKIQIKYTRWRRWNTELDHFGAVLMCVFATMTKHFEVFRFVHLSPFSQSRSHSLLWVKATARAYSRHMKSAYANQKVQKATTLCFYVINHFIFHKSYAQNILQNYYCDDDDDDGDDDEMCILWTARSVDGKWLQTHWIFMFVRYHNTHTKSWNAYDFGAYIDAARICNLFAKNMIESHNLRFI